jgi:hypothetical protein
MVITRQKSFSFQRLRRAGWAKLVVLCMALFVALVPVAQAFCLMDSPAGSPSSVSIGADGHAGSPAGDEAPDPCCEQSPFVLAAPCDKADDLATASARTLAEPVMPVAMARQPSFRPNAQTTPRADSLPPPEQLFRRLKRLLI